MDGEFAVVFDEAQLSELVHEKINARAGSAHHFSKGGLADFGDFRSFGDSTIAEAGKEKEDSSEALFAGIEQLVDEVFLIADVPGQQVFHK